MNKIIFLDIDGVLNSMDFLHLNILNARVNDAVYTNKDKHGSLFDPRCILAFNTLIKATDADIVISSDWRFSGLNAMKHLWSDRELSGNIIGVTPFTGGIRGSDVDDFMRFNDMDFSTDKILIIDDNSDFFDFQMPNLIQTNPTFGLTFKDVLKGIDILNNKKNS